MDERLQVNRRNWNELTPIHAASDFYDVEGFKAGRLQMVAHDPGSLGDIRARK